MQLPPTDLTFKALGRLRDILHENTPIAIAVSGGADSMALALLVQEWAKAPFTALIVDHGIRPESAEEAETVKGWLQSRGIQSAILKGKALEIGSGLQERAREYRYRLMLDWCHANGVGHLLLAHHADDQRETILMRLIRASGVDGLAGMKPVSKREGIVLIRPLLGIPKCDLISYLKERGQAWAEDPTNENTAYTRTRIRHLNLSLKNEGLSPERLNLINKNLSRTSSYLAEQTFNFIEGNGRFLEEGYADLNMAALVTSHEEIRLRALKKIILFVNGGSPEPRFEEVLRLSESLMQKEEFTGATLAHVEFLKKGDQLYAIREFSRMASLEVNPGWLGVYDGRYRVAIAAELPVGQTRIAPLGQGYLGFPPEVLKHNEHLPKKLLMTFPALFHLEAPVCVPHMKWSLEERMKNALNIAYLTSEAEENACCGD